MRFSIYLLSLAHRLHIPASMENPQRSRIWLCPPVLALMRRKHVAMFLTHFCCWGKPFRKATSFMGVWVDYSRIEAHQCRGGKRGLCLFTGKPHQQLVGQNSSGQVVDQACSTVSSWTLWQSGEVLLWFWLHPNLQGTFRQFCRLHQLAYNFGPCLRVEWTAWIFNMEANVGHFTCAVSVIECWLIQLHFTEAWVNIWPKRSVTREDHICFQTPLSIGSHRKTWPFQRNFDAQGSHHFLISPAH